MLVVQLKLVKQLPVNLVGVNLTRTVLHGATHNPWKHGHTPGGSSGGTASAVAGGLVSIATGGDGGGSIRIPAGFTGLLGLKATFGRIPRGPGASNGNLTTVTGCLSRSVRDTARWFDVANGHEAHDPLSLPRVSGWEAGLGNIETAGFTSCCCAELWWRSCFACDVGSNRTCRRKF
ncbi:putative amidase AF_1954 [Acidimicrobiaceae bacterium]|nr:putative amidase AF_1954 [Acidimicrobiaceae bacterium]